MSNALSLSKKVLGIVIMLNLLFGAGIVIMLIFTFVAKAFMLRALGIPPGPDGLLIGMRLIMVIGIAGVCVMDFLLKRLSMIVDTVSTGDPFVAANVARLQAIAWALLVLELLHYAVGATANSLSSAAMPINISWGFSLTRWLAVLLLFVLARVFEQGTRMREDLEGTV